MSTTALPLPATWWWRVGDSQREACTTRHPTPNPVESEPSHPRRGPAGGGGIPRPRLRFGITSTTSTSRLITLSAASAAVVVGCGETVVEVAAEGEEGETKTAATQKGKKKIMKWTSGGNRGIIIRAPTTKARGWWPRGRKDSVSLYKLGAVRYRYISLLWRKKKGSNVEKRFVSYAGRTIIIHSSDVMDLWAAAAMAFSF